MHLPKYALLLGALISLCGSDALASPSRSGSSMDAMTEIKDAFRQFAIGYQSLGAEIAYLQTERGLGASLLPNSGSQPQDFLKPNAGNDLRSSMPVRESVDAWLGHTDAVYSSGGNGNAKAEHDSLRVGIVPEPASLVAWTLIGTVFGVGAWKRRRGAA